MRAFTGRGRAEAERVRRPCLADRPGCPPSCSATGVETRMGQSDCYQHRNQAHATEPADQHVVRNVPALSEPILLFMESPAFVPGLAAVPSWQVVHARSFEEFSAALPERKYAMLIALSPSADSGAAGRSIQTFRSLNPAHMTEDHVTDY